MKARSKLASWNDAPSSRRLGAMVVVAFFATVLVFVLSSVAEDHRERGIIHAAQSVSDVALPSIQHLANARTALRHTEVLLDDLTGGLTSERKPEELLAELQRSRALLDREWQDYRSIGRYRGEEQLQAATEDALRSVRSSVDEALLQLREGNEARARIIRNAQAAPALERLDASLHALLDMNAVRGAEESNRIATIREEARLVGLSLQVAAAVVAAIAGVLVVRLVARFASVMNLRVSELGHFAGRVAHDIRSPLNAVGMALELAGRDPKLDDRTRSRLGRSVGTVQRIGKLVDGLLLFAAAGAPPPEGARADVRQTLTGLLADMLPRAEEKEIELRADELDAGEVGCSPGVLTSLLVNLIGNAIKYMGESAVRKVRVRVLDRGSMMRVEVADTGAGVPRELRERIFDPHVRAATSDAAGFGLGLATVRRLVEAHGGSVGVEGNPEGGSVFWFELPKAAATSHA